MKTFCETCNKETETEIRTQKETFKVEGEDIPYTLECNVRVCSECGTDIWDKELDSQTLEKLYKMHKEAHPEFRTWGELKRIYSEGKKALTHFEKDRVYEVFENKPKCLNTFCIKGIEDFKVSIYRNGLEYNVVSDRNKSFETLEESVKYAYTELNARLEKEFPEDSIKTLNAKLDRILKAVEKPVLKDYCLNCRKETEYKLDKIDITKNIKGTLQTFGMTVAFCSECGAEMSPPGLIDRNIKEFEIIRNAMLS